MLEMVLGSDGVNAFGPALRTSTSISTKTLILAAPCINSFALGSY
jgi:hypothetical protein